MSMIVLAIIVIILLKISRLYSCVSYPKPKPGGDAVSGCKQQVEVAECSERLPVQQGGREVQPGRVHHRNELKSLTSTAT